MKRPRQHYGRKYEVKMWTPPEGILRVASSRTRGMTGYFIETASRDHMKWIDQLYELTAAAYLQGINDAVEAEMQRLARGSS